MRLLFLLKSVQLNMSLTILVLLLFPTEICFPHMEDILPSEYQALFVSDQKTPEVKENRKNGNGCSEHTQANFTYLKEFFPIEESPLLSSYLCVKTGLKQRYCDKRRSYLGDPEFCLDQQLFLIPTVLSGGAAVLGSVQLLWLVFAKPKKYLDQCSNFFSCILWLIATAVLLHHRMEWSSSWREEWLGWKDGVSIGMSRHTPLYPVVWSVALLTSAGLLCSHLLEVAMPNRWVAGHIQVSPKYETIYYLQPAIPH